MRLRIEKRPMSATSKAFAGYCAKRRKRRRTEFFEYWIIDKLGVIPNCGPYASRSEADADRRGLLRTIEDEIFQPA